MGLTEAGIRNCTSDDELFDALAGELERQLPSALEGEFEIFFERLRRLPTGLRAMASIYQLDVSMTLDDLGWHFANWHHRPYCDETLRGLKELEAHEAAEIFASAYTLMQPYWETIGHMVSRDFDKFVKWYPQSELEKSLDPLNRRMWDLCEALECHGLLTYWLTYARKYPHRVLVVAQ